MTPTTGLGQHPAPRARGGWRGWVSGHPALTVLGLLALLFWVVLGGWLVYLDDLVSEVPRFDAQLDRPGRPARVPGDAVNLLLAGVDDGHGTDLRGALEATRWPIGVFRSDTIMVVHLGADGRGAQVVSIPRDSYAEVPGFGRTKINAAFSYGGPALLAATVERLTGLHLDHVAVVDWAGFQDVTDAVGGVEVRVAGEGTVHLDGAEALAYVRERHSLPRGDLDRMLRQQNYLRAVLAQSADAGVLANPVRLSRLIRSVAGHLAVDDGLDDAALRALILRNRHLRPAHVRFLSVPVRGLGTAEGASVVFLDVPATRRMFTALAEDRLSQWKGLDSVVELPTTPP